MRTTRRYFLPFLLVSSLGTFISPAFAWRRSSDAYSRVTLAALLAAVVQTYSFVGLPPGTTAGVVHYQTGQPIPGLYACGQVVETHT